MFLTQHQFSNHSQFLQSTPGATVHYWYVSDQDVGFQVQLFKTKEKRVSAVINGTLVLL